MSTLKYLLYLLSYLTKEITIAICAEDITRLHCS